VTATVPPKANAEPFESTNHRESTGALPDATAQLAALVVGAARHTGVTIGTAESLTGGLVAAALTSVPGASAVVRGGVISYATALKHQILGVSADLLTERGAVDPDVAAAMARGARHVLGSDWAIATTGVAGPDPADGKPVGTVFVAVAGPSGIRTSGLVLTGSRAEIRAATVDAALELLAEGLADVGVAVPIVGGVVQDRNPSTSRRAPKGERP
jgi:nicotinamide-nucleotide amidase